eukprot:308178-Chlamydomonas_euryale.AAC.1
MGYALVTQFVHKLHCVRCVQSVGAVAGVCNQSVQLVLLKQLVCAVSWCSQTPADAIVHATQCFASARADDPNADPSPLPLSLIHI